MKTIQISVRNSLFTFRLTTIPASARNAAVVPRRNLLLSQPLSAGSLQTPCPAALSVSYTKSHSACTDKMYGDTGGNASAIDKPMP